MNDNHPTLVGYILWLALVLGLLALGHHFGLLSEIDNRDPAAGSHIPAYVHD